MNNYNLVILRFYLWLMGFVLLGQSVISLLLKLIQIEPPTLIYRLFRADDLHSAIHLGWGLTILLLIQKTRLIPLLGLFFGIFYLILGFLGIAIYHPLGLLLGRGENLFHLIVGSIALILSLWMLSFRKLLPKKLNKY